MSSFPKCIFSVVKLSHLTICPDPTFFLAYNQLGLIKRQEALAFEQLSQVMALAIGFSGE